MMTDYITLTQDMEVYNTGSLIRALIGEEDYSALFAEMPDGYFRMEKSYQDWVLKQLLYFLSRDARFDWPSVLPGLVDQAIKLKQTKELKDGG